jgi:condensin-2 complex subunit H2
LRFGQTKPTPPHNVRSVRSNLADNWNIDIASELEEYLHELESITFSFDGIGKSLNFAEGTIRYS